MLKDRVIGTVTAHYNNGKYAKEFFSGILNQTVKPYFICIVDDGSKWPEVEMLYLAFQELGGTLDTVQPKMDGSHIYGWHFGRINGIRTFFYIAKENKGPAAARNIAVQKLISSGAHFLQIADSDDVLYPKKIEKGMDIMQKYPYIGLVYSDYDTLTESNNSTKREFKESFSFNRLSQECIVSNNSLVSVEALKITGRYDETLFGPEDYDMWLRIAEKFAVYHIPESLYKYRISGNNITITTPKQKFAQHVMRVHEKARERLYGKE